MDWDDIQREFDRVNEMSCKPVGLQKYKVGHIFDENMSVKWNQEKLEEENKKYNDEVARLNTEKNKGFCRANDGIPKNTGRSRAWAVRTRRGNDIQLCL